VPNGEYEFRGNLRERREKRDWKHEENFWGEN